MKDGAIFELLPPVLATLGVLVGVSSLLLSSSSMARQWPGAFQRVTGYAMAALGGLALASSGVALFTLNDVPGGPWDLVDGGLAISAVLGLTMLLGGSRRARNAPVDRDTEPLRALAADMLSQLEDAERDAGRYGSKHVDLRPLATSRSVRSPSLIAQLRSAPEPVLVLTGPPGSGKSTTLRALTHEICRNARSERSPQVMAVYVDLAAMPSSPSVATAPQLRAHVLNSIAKTDDVMRGKLEASLEGDADRAKWIFMFDSLDEIAVGWPTDNVAERMREFMAELDRFLRPGDLRFRAIVAMRDSILLPATIPAVGIAPLSRGAQRRIMSLAGLDSVDQEHALDQLRQSAGELAGRPLAFNLWCETVTSTVSGATQIAAPDNLYDVLAGTVGVRLSERSVPTPADAATLRFLADDIAYCMLTEPGLAMARRPYTFAFTHRSFQDFFASSWLMRNASVVDLDHVLTDRRWRDPMIMAMQAGSDDFRIAVLGRAAGLLADLARPLISDLSIFLDTAPNDALPVVFDRSTTAPNPKLTHILSVVAAVPPTSLALVPDLIREVTDRVAVTAFAQGDRTDQRDVLTVLRLMSPHVAKWSAERAVHRGGLLLETTALTLFRAQRPIHDLSPSSRFGLIAGLAGLPVISRQILHASNSGTSLGTLTALVRDLVLALRVGAGLMLAAWLYTGVRGAADAPEVAVLSGLIGTHAARSSGSPSSKENVSHDGRN